MNISYRWLKEFVRTTTTPEKLADALRVASCEVESIESWSEKLKGLVVGKVLTVSPHPNADRLRVATVLVGKDTKTIVCGAPNLAEGQTVVVALPGVTIHPVKGDPFTLSESSIRGMKSEGMLCAAEEIGLALPSEGILVLDESLVAGTDFAKAAGLDDIVLDLEITPNRPDLLSHIGIAREVAALEKKSLAEPALASFERILDAAPAKVTIDDPSLCLRYSAVVLEGIRDVPSPLWMQARLLLSGVRPISAVVDVTNYVMLELGQPMHAFDLDRLGDTISVRSSHRNERLTTLDGIDRQLESGDIMITGQKGKAVALAGIMGGATTEISNGTTRVLLESACFAGAHIRRTSRRLGLRSEASGRFEKGLDPEQTVVALKRAVYLLQQVADVKVIGGLIDVYPANQDERPRIHLTFARVQQLLGIHISAAETKSILQHLGFQTPSLTKSSFDAIPPSWRRDVSIPEDVVEELIRIWGFDRLPAALPSGVIKAPVPNAYFNDKRRARRALAGAGLHETVHLSFTSLQTLEKMGEPASSCVKLDYPLSVETEYLVPSHLPHFLENYAGTNIKETTYGLFEIGRVFRAPHSEQERLSLILRGNDAEELYRVAKTALRRLLAALERLDDTYELVSTEDGPSQLVAGSVLQISVKGVAIGYLGLVKPEIISVFKIRSGRTLLFASLDLEKLLATAPVHLSYRPVSAFPGIERDLTVIAQRSMPASDLLRLIESAQPSGIERRHEIVGIFAGKPLADNEKSFTVHFEYSCPDRTLVDDEVNQDQNMLTALLTEKLKVKVG
ncbi:MAG: phenylalanine--tRNA ligase subunit beta [bacterium]